VEQSGLQPRSNVGDRDGDSDRRILVERSHNGSDSRRNSSNDSDSSNDGSVDSSARSSRRRFQASTSPRKLRSAEDMMRSRNTGFSDSDIIVREADLQAVVASERDSVEVRVVPRFHRLISHP